VSMKFRLLLPSLAVLSSLIIPGVNNAVGAEKNFEVWLEGVRVEALKRGIKPEIVSKALVGFKPIRRIIQRDRNQPEFKLTMARYQKRVVTKRNIAVGRKKAKRYAKLLNSVSQKYGVQPRFILAIWAIETRYGAIEANVPLIPSLATLAFDARRSTFFRKQLFAALQMVNRGHIDLNSLFGSWAGAMGQPQFMPSSYLAFAQDFDGDGRRDIWKNEGDVFASIANYLAKHGWRSDMTWGRPVKVPAAIIAGLGKPDRRAAPGCRATTYPQKRLSQWQKLGVRKIDGTNLPTRDLKAALIRPDGNNGDAYLVYRNYAAIMAYNCAHLYAVTVGTLADRIKG
jgi:membrane-bound lytic murein transglycosylase B